MMQSFTVEPVERDQIAATYPLVREIVPDMDRAAWLRFARRATAPGAAGRNGIMIACENDRRFPFGLFCYRTTIDPKHQTVLWADHFIALHVLDPGPVIDALIAELDCLAARLDCAAIRSVVHTGGSDVAGRLIRAGHSVEGAQFCKVVKGDKSPASRTSLLFAIPTSL